jgi:hypothetical protein
MEQIMKIADKDFYKPVGKPDFIEADETAFRDFSAYCDGVLLPHGVHILSQESQDIMQRIAERSAALEAGFTKRVS